MTSAAAAAAVVGAALALAPAAASATPTSHGQVSAVAAAPDVNVANVKAHLTQLNTIATQNGGNRRAGSAGYTASVAYLKAKLTAAGFTVAEQTCTSCTYRGNNLVADWPGGPSDQVTMFGAHLDSVAAGPGINDNGSGSATLLENALALAAANPTMSRHVRFAWWNGEEQGLQGSKFYTAQLTSTQKSAIKAYYNFDMVGSPNGGYFINNISSAASAPMKAYWVSKNLQPEENVEGQGRSDDYSFQQAGIATSGYAAGASATKSSAQAAKWGGTANRAYDSCYHASCDTTSNISDAILNNAADGVAYTLWATSVSGTTTPTNDFSVSLSPASGSASAGQSTTSTVSTATTSGSAQTVALSASGAPSGVTVSFSPSSVQSGSSSTMTVAVGSSAASGTYPITVTGAGSVAHTATYSLTVGGGSGCTGAEVVRNGGFESGTTPWTTTSGVITNDSRQAAHGGSYKAWLNGYGSSHTDSAAQTLTIPAGCSTYTLAFWLHIDTAETGSTVYDRLTATIGSKTLGTWSNVSAATGYSQKTFDVSAYAGQSVSLKFSGTEDAGLQTSFVVDDVSVTGR
ncbi:hypothetical protein GCM10023145_30380 [Angustibacter luteus]